MLTYKAFRPTQFDPASLACDDQQDWFVCPAQRTRDSNVLEEANWRAQQNILGGEEHEDWHIHRFGHWACGWFEIVLVRPGSPAAAEAESIENALSDYPILDDRLFCEMEIKAACQLWEHMSLEERISECKRAHVSILAARRDYPPDAVEQRLTGEV